MARTALAVLTLAVSLGAQEKPVQEKPPDPRPGQREEDPGRPVLKRGGPAQQRQPVTPSSQRTPSPPAGEIIEVDEQGRTVANTAGDAPAPTDLISRAREEAFRFNEGLPNFVCDELVRRFESRTLKPDWKYKDRIEVELLYLSGKEEYRNVRRNGKLLNKGDPEASGTWSTGEFGTILVDILHPSSKAKFKLRGGSSAAGMNAQVYNYRIEQVNSNWRIRFGTEVKPAYNGALWIDPESARVLRIEMDSKELPKDFPIDKVETVVDYGWVLIGGKRFLLPVRSENLSCAAGAFDCTKNEIEFRNYRKFEVESQVLTTDSEISFPEAQPEKKQGKKEPYQAPSIQPETTKPPKKK